MEIHFFLFYFDDFPQAGMVEVASPAPPAGGVSGGRGRPRTPSSQPRPPTHPDT